MKYEQWSPRRTDQGVRRKLEAAGIPHLTAAVLCARGLDTVEACRVFFADGEELLHDPMLLRDMERAVARVNAALESGETIAVYGDYDVDGITSTCLLTHFLQSRGATVISYIPDRMEEGYGLNREAVRLLAERGTTLIVTVDCGITALEEVDYAASIGVDVVITDHHECKETLPSAAAVVNPHRPDCGYPFSDLAGVGVALKLVLALGGAGHRSELLRRYANLAAVGTIADVMRLVGENRTIVNLGLRLLQSPDSPGLRALFRAAGVEGKPVSAVTVGYILSPRINASGRMGRASVAAELLLTRDERRAEDLARELCELNRERQAIEGQIFQECAQRLEREPGPGAAIVLADHQWHQGVVGIVASRLAERFGCPAFIICLSDGKGKGSCRSFGGLNVFAALEQCGDLLEGFGGHEMAAGFTIREDRIDAFRDRITAYIAARRTELAAPALTIDLELDGAQCLTQSEVKALAALEPHGQGNPRPVFSLHGVTVTALAEIGGGKHLKMTLRKGSQLLDAIFFSVDAARAGIAAGDRIDIAFSPGINEFRGRQTVQLQLEDLRPAVSRVQHEHMLYDKMRQGSALTPQEAKSLTPSREEFAAVWRYLKCAAGCSRREYEPGHLAHNIAKAYRLRETFMRTMVCLDVLDERGLIRRDAGEGGLSIVIVDGAKKVNLEESCIMRRLRALACE
ncbi:MAG: Single-stranded-D-specific exonuclease RecJ [Oscillospiraceae bacterium]|nr:Single-stranded-D-specific exonuclease RecJ [Oscillospiraceae bacterium]